jgi:hypothetical protein
VNPKRVELHIEELVLRGFAPGERSRIGEAVERDLARRFAEQGVPQSLAWEGKIARADGGMFEAKLSMRAEEIGTQIGRAVYGGLSR